MITMHERYDVVVIGAGHAGCEAARACARMGLRTAIVTMNLDLIAQMSCNPAIGGIAKGHLVREIDALGGVMGEVTDAVGIQFRLLNTSRGPAVWSPRAQCDKQQYRLKMREVLESQPNLKIKQAEVAELIVEDAENQPRRQPPQKPKTGLSGDPGHLGAEETQGLGSAAAPGCGEEASGVDDCAFNTLPPTLSFGQYKIARGIKLRDGRTVGAQAIIITTGTFLNGLIHC